MNNPFKFTLLQETFLFFLFLLAYPGHLLASEAILQFTSTITVSADASITVTENIKARCLGRNMKHGIYRDIPVRYKRSDGSVVDSRFKLLQVKIDGRPAKWHTSRRDDDIRIYMGSANRLLPHGIHSFELTYRMERMIGYFHDYDELYWNVTGDQWRFPIEKAVCQVLLPGDTRVIQHASYTGPHGSRQTMAMVTENRPGSITFETASVLRPGAGFTIAVAWPPGVVTRPTLLQNILFLIRDNMSFAAGLLGTLVTFVYFFFTWKKVGKDPEKGNIIPRFDPPKGFGPAAARYIMKMGFDNGAFSAAVINLAVNGYLEIREDEGRFTLVRKRQGEKGALSEGEKRLFSRLFSGMDELELSRHESHRLKAALEALKNSLKAHFERIYFMTNTRQLVPGLVLSAVTLALMALGSSDIFGAAFMSLWLSGWSGFTAFLAYTAYTEIKQFMHTKSMNALKNVGKPALFALPFIFFWFVGCAFYGKLAGFYSLAVFIVLVALNLAFYQLLKAPTMKGRKIMDQIEGFRMFLETAEKHRLEQLVSPEHVPELFERYLPWAVALGVENQWAEKFSRYLAKAGSSTGTYTPSWYIGSHFTPTSLSSALGSGMTSAVTGATFSGGSSGSGGGGFSGGGGGGGGGGGW